METLYISLQKYIPHINMPPCMHEYKLLHKSAMFANVYWRVKLWLG